MELWDIYDEFRNPKGMFMKEENILKGVITFSCSCMVSK